MSQAQQMIRHSSIYAVGNISRQLVGFIMLPIYTHYLTPSDYGVIGLLVFLVSLFEIVLGGHMFQAVPKFYHQEEHQKQKNTVVSTAFIVTTLFSGFACIVMSTFSSEMSKMTFGNSKYDIYIIIFSVLILTHALELYSLTYIRILKKPWTYFIFNMAKLALQLITNVYTIVILDWGLMGLALSSISSSLIISILLSTYTLKRTGIKLNKKIAMRIILFSWPLWISGFIGLYIGSSNRYFIRIFSSLDDVGLFELAAKFGFIGMILVWNPFSQYWQTERFAIAKTPNPYPSYSLASRLITALLLITGVGIGLFSDIAIKIMSAIEFHNAVHAIPFLIFASIFQSLTIFNNFSFMYTSRTLEITKNNIVTAISITAFYFLLIPNYGFIGASIGLALGSVVQYAYALYMANKVYPLKIKQRHLAMGSLITASVFLIDYMQKPEQINVEAIFFKITLAASAAIFITLLTFDMNELRSGIKTVLNRKNNTRSP